MKLEGIMLIEISQTEKDTYCKMSLIYGIKKKTARLIETETRTVVVSGRCWSKGANFQL